MVDWATSQFGFSVILMVALLVAILTAVAYCIYFERKISAWVQDRIGPNRVGPKGLLQPIADGVKFLLKEDFIPARVDRPLFILAPMLAFAVALVGFAVIPWGGTVEFASGKTVQVQVANPDIGLLYLLALGALSVYGVVLGGWASNNKYSLYGGLRAAAQMLSYEVPMALSILVVVMASGQLKLDAIVLDQINTHWNVLLHPVAFILLLTTLFAETNRAPFDLAEAEQELVGGFHTEYSGMKFALFFLGEYAHMIVGSAFVISLFLGGYHLPFVPWCQPENTTLTAAIVKTAVFGLKIAAFIFFFMWVRWTLMRFRFDQLMRLAWKGMVPLSMGLVALTGILVYLDRQTSLWSTLGNVVLVVIMVVCLRNTEATVTGRQENMPDIVHPAAY